MLCKQNLIRKGPTSKDIGLVSSVINGDSIDDEVVVVDNEDIVLFCEVVFMGSC